MNKLIGLAKSSPGWPSVLKNLGYSVDYIEPSFRNGDGKKVNPDILFSSNKLRHCLIVECKSHTIEEEQLTRYSTITKEGLIDKTKLKEPKMLTFDGCLAMNEDLHIKQKKLINEKLGWPMIFFTNNSISKENSFKNIQLEKEFKKSISTGENAPTHYFPFSEKDEHAIIAMSVFQQIISTVIKDKVVEFDSELILSKAHPFWNSFDASKKGEYKAKVDTVIADFQKKELSEYLEKIKGHNTWRITKPLDKLAKECNRIVDDLSQQTKLSLKK